MSMHKGLALVLVLVLLTTLSIIAVRPVKAQPITIIVPDDYPTITAAIGNATTGDTVLVRSGIYNEHSLVITKSISLVGENPQSTTIKDIDPQFWFLGSGLLEGPTAITISSDNVTISGFTIITNDTGADIPGCSIAGGGFGTLIIGDNLPDGIALSSGTYQSIAQNTLGNIHSEAPYTLIKNNTLTGPGALSSGAFSGALIWVEAAGNKGYDNVIYDNSIIGNNVMQSQGSNAGIDIYESYGDLVTSNTISNCYLSINVDIGSNNTVSANTITGGFFGLTVVQGGVANTFYANNVVSNTYATAISGWNNTLYDNNFINNLQKIGSPDLIMGPNPAGNTFWYNGTVGNYWSDYFSKYPNATEIDSSGIGDTPYVINASVTDPYPLMLPYNLASASISLPQWVKIPVFNPIQFPAPIQSPSRTPSPTPNPSSTTIPTSTVPEFPAWTNPLVAIVMVAAVGFSVYFKKRRSQKWTGGI